MPAPLLFARYAPRNLQPASSIGSKWIRLLERLDLKSAVEGKRTAIKLHLGGGTGFTTVHPFFVRKLVEKVKSAGAREVFATDSPGSVRSAADRGYTSEVLGCPIVSISGTADKYSYKIPVKPAVGKLTEIEVGGEIVDAEALIDLSHVKAHGACGFGGASKNLSMGCVVQSSRGRLHGLEGGLKWDSKKCNRCKLCQKNCDSNAISFNKSNELEIFFHNCRLCQHCALICPKKAIKIDGGGYKQFQRGMAAATTAILKTFNPRNVVFINVLMDITLFCDCWGMTSPTIVPEIGILAGRDIVAIEQATLDLIKVENYIPGSLPPGYTVRENGGHLFERIHGKDPFVIVEALAALKQGTRHYKLTEVH